MDTNPTPITPALGAAVTYGGEAGTVIGIGTVYRDDRPVPQWVLTTPTGMVRVTGNEVYGMEAR
jgi:hypothetical protein